MLHTSFGFTTPCLVGCCNRVYPCLGKFFTHFLNVCSPWFYSYSGLWEASAKASLLMGGEENKKGKAQSTFLFHACSLYCKCHTLKAMLNFIEFLCAECFFSVSRASLSLQCVVLVFIQHIFCNVTSVQCVWVVLEKTCCCGVKVMLRS